MEMLRSKLHEDRETFWSDTGPLTADVLVANKSRLINLRRDVLSAQQPTVYYVVSPK